MKTPQTPANLAIKALADSIAASVVTVAQAAYEAQNAAQLGDMNLTVVA